MASFPLSDHSRPGKIPRPRMNSVGWPWGILIDMFGCHGIQFHVSFSRVLFLHQQILSLFMSSLTHFRIKSMLEARPISSFYYYAPWTERGLCACNHCRASNCLCSFLHLWEQGRRNRQTGFRSSLLQLQIEIWYSQKITYLQEIQS